ncbi:hypothetical protein H2203_009119 [Taxawa tesnikishii (nom. ined.)]|nr:hypothetical protein H2203_009119 [Dothideales sp. JES 119]
MAKLAYIFFIYIKANAHHTSTKLNKALEEINSVRRSLPLHLSPHFPANRDDVEWEKQHPWVSFQRYLIAHVLDFMQLSILRVLVMVTRDAASRRYRTLAVESACRILANYNLPGPRVYRLVWTVSASTVAAGIYLALDHLMHTQGFYSTANATEHIELIRTAAHSLREHSSVTVHAAKGSDTLERLIQLIGKWQPSEGMKMHSLRTMLAQISAENSLPPQTGADNSINDDLELGQFDMEQILSGWSPDAAHTAVGSGNQFDMFFSDAWRDIVMN